MVKPATIQVQSVLFNTEPERIRRALASLARSAQLALRTQAVSAVQVAYGDGSPNPCLSTGDLSELQAEYRDLLEIRYDFFDRNLGSAAGHNRLAEECEQDFLLIQNPDVIVSPRLIENLLAPFETPGVGMTEAKQLPIEHPKDYDPVTGETSWATTACSMIPVPLFEELGGFDAATFFLYCDDVDFSWRVRLSGCKVVFVPSAGVFHDKRLSETGEWQASAAERYYSAEAALLLAHKWSRPDRVRKILEDFDNIPDENLRKAASVFREREAGDRLPTPLDPEHQVGQFVGQYYAKHRFDL
jgi:GT2 family glycosyltransferase